MKSSDPNAHSALEHRALLLLLIVVTLAFGWVLLPFYETIVWGSIIALLFAPLHHRLLPHLKHQRNAAALLTLTVVLVIVIIPLALITASLASEAGAVYARLQSGKWNPALYFKAVFEALPKGVVALLDRFGLANFDTLQRRLAAALAQGSQFIATRALNIGQNTIEFVTALFITLYLAFFLIRDGEAVARAVRRAIPLAPAHKLELLDKFATVIRATVKGNLVVAAVQGLLGGLAFWFLGVQRGLAVGRVDGLPVAAAGGRRRARVAAGGGLLPADGCAVAGHRADRVWRAGDRPGRQPAAAGAGGQGHAHARLPGDDHDAGRDGRVRHQWLRDRPGDCGDVHRGLAHLRHDAVARPALSDRQSAPPYSWRSASIGSIRAARRAGK